MSSFTDSLIISPSKDYKHWILRKKFSYHVGHKNSNDIIEVPVGFITDFASIPRIFWNIAPKWGRYGKSAIIHDYLYCTHERSRKEADDIFYEAMLVSKVPKWKAKIMYWCVRLFGQKSYTNNNKTFFNSI